MELREYQREAIAAVDDAAARGVNRQLIALPTGTGKTVIFASLAQQRNGRTLILAHRDELIQQAVDKVQTVWPTAAIGVVKAARNETQYQVTVASVQSLSRQNRLDALGGYDLLITDEAHHAIAPTYQRIYDHLGDVLHVGVTATPKRGDKAGLAAVYDEVVYSKTLLEMIQNGYLSDLRGLRVRTEVDLSGVRSVAGDFVERDLAEAVNTPERNAAIVEAWQEHAAERRTLAFTVNVQHAQDLAEAFQGAGVKAQAVSGQTPLEERRALLAAFGRGELDVLCNCQLLTEGYDEPAVACIVVARPTQSQACYIQMVGRGARLYPGKADCLVIDVADNSRRHDLVQLPDLFGLEYTASTGGGRKTILEQVEEREERKRRETRTVVETVDLFGRSRFTWLTVGNSFFLSVPGHGQIRLTRDGQGFTASLYVSGGNRRLLTERPLDLGWAQGIAEDEARRLLDGKTKVLDRDAPWRKQPASDKQREALRKMGLRYSNDISKGEASDLIGMRVAANQARWAS